MMKNMILKIKPAASKLTKVDGHVSFENVSFRYGEGEEPCA